MKTVPSHWLIGVMAFVSGVMLGVAGGLLCAPKSGKGTREDLQDLAADTLDQAEEWMNTTKESFREFFKKGETSV